MNNTNLIGRITKDSELKMYGEKAFVSFNLAVDNYNSKNGEKGADFIPVKVWGNLAENLYKHCKKGSKIAVVGRLQSGSYDKDGQKIFTLDVVASSIEYLGARTTVNNDVEENTKTNDMSFENDFDDSDMPF